MGIFSKLTEKKECGICGKELGLLGKSKVEDGYICKECGQGLSPFFHNARHTTIEKIEEQINERKRIKEGLRDFNPTREYGANWRILIDDARQAVVVSARSDWRTANTDIIPFDRFRGADVRVEELKEEQHYEDSEGKRQSYDPPRYDTYYDFWLKIRTNVSYIPEIEFKVNEREVENRFGAEYDRYERMAAEMRDAIRNLGSASPFGAPMGGAAAGAMGAAGYAYPGGGQPAAGFAAGGQAPAYPGQAGPGQAGCMPPQPMGGQPSAYPGGGQAPGQQGWSSYQGTAPQAGFPGAPQTGFPPQGAPAQTAYSDAATQAGYPSSASGQAAQAAQVAPTAAPTQAAAVAPQFCPSCGAPSSGGRFCESCGSALT